MDSTGVKNATALHMAILHRQTKVVDWLLSNGADPTIRAAYLSLGGESFSLVTSFELAELHFPEYDLLSQDQLQRIFTNMTGGSSTLTTINCLGWDYSVKFDLFHQDRDAFLNAPRDAIGYQVADHEISRGTKRWIRLTTYPGA